MTMFFRIADRVLQVTRGPSMPALSAPLGAFAEMTALRWCPGREEVLVIAVPEGSPPPRAPAERGNVRLFRWRLGDDGWDEVFAGYAHDAVALRRGGYAVHEGDGLTLLADDGTVSRKLKLGRFNWGPASLTASPGGERLAWIRWRGDDRRICAQRVFDEAPREYGVSCRRYAWIGDDSLAYCLNGPLRVLDLESGNSSTLVSSVIAAGRGRRFGDRVLDRYVCGRVAQVEESFQSVHVAGGRVWFAALLFSTAFGWRSAPRFNGLFSVDRDGGDFELVASVPKQELITDVALLQDGSALIYTERYRRMRIVARPRHPVGPLAGFLAEGWEPMPTSQEPEFGFHTLPGT